MDESLKAGLRIHRDKLKKRVQTLHTISDEQYDSMKAERASLIEQMSVTTTRLADLRQRMKDYRKQVKSSVGGEIAKVMREIQHVTALLGEKEEG